jgi:hypothetical protein
METSPGRERWAQLHQYRIKQTDTALPGDKMGRQAQPLRLVTGWGAFGVADADASTVWPMPMLQRCGRCRCFDAIPKVIMAVDAADLSIDNAKAALEKQEVYLPLPRSRVFGLNCPREHADRICHD